MNVSNIKWRKGVFLYVLVLYLFNDVEEFAATLYILEAIQHVMSAKKIKF